jgi:hypothetical protein
MLTQDKAWITGKEGQPVLIRVNLRIKMVIIIVLKINSRANPR